MFSLSGLIPTLPQAHHNQKHKKNVNKKREHANRVGKATSFTSSLIVTNKVKPTFMMDVLEIKLPESLINTNVFNFVFSPKFS